MDAIRAKLSFLGKPLLDEILEKSQFVEAKKDTVVLKEGQMIAFLPIVLEGSVKVFASFEDKELLLYYIGEKESCIMSFSAFMENRPSEVFGITEQDSTILLLPVNRVEVWMNTYPQFNQLYFKQFSQRYSKILLTVKELLFKRMDERLVKYLLKRQNLNNNQPVKIKHREIANDLGTAREVVSRALKKLELDGKIEQNSNGIFVYL